MISSESYLSFFTPGQMSRETLEFILVKRQKLIDRLVDRVRRSVLTEAKHQSILLGPRGMGKSHVIALVYHRVKALPELTDKVVIAWLAEEEWGVASLTDLFIVILKALAREYPQSRLQADIDSLYNLPAEHVGDRAAQLLRDFAAGRTLLLLIENLEEIFRGLGEAGQWAFRSFLSERPFVTILATTPSLFTAIQKQQEAFYGFFQDTYLDELSPEEATELLGKVAERRNDIRLRDFLQTTVAQDRVQAVHDLAGGHPRIYLLFAHLITQESLDELVTPFLQLLDELTPYYQSRMQLLSPQQRKIAEYLCDCRGAAIVKDIAARNLLSPQIAAKQLGDLERMQYVRKTPVGRESFYELREPLLRMVVEMKRGRGEPIRLVIDFLRRWYSRAERRERLMNSPDSASLTRQYFEASLDLELAQLDTPNPARADSLSPEYRKAVDSKDFGRAAEIIAEIIERKGSSCTSDDWIRHGYCNIFAGNFDQGLTGFNKAIEIEPLSTNAWFNRGIALGKSSRHYEALTNFDKVIEIDPTDAKAWFNRGIALDRLYQHITALASYDKVLEIEPLNANAWFSRGVALGRLNKYSEALASYNKVLEIEPLNANAWFNRGIALYDLDQYIEAIVSYGKAVEIAPNHADIWFNLAATLHDLDQYTESLACYDKVIELEPKDMDAWFNRGVALYDLGQYIEALESFDKAIEIEPINVKAWFNRGIALGKLDNYTEALASYDKAIEIEPTNSDARFGCGEISLLQNQWGEFISMLKQGFANAEKEDGYRGDTQEYCRVLLERSWSDESKQLAELSALYADFNAVPQLAAGLMNSLPSLFEPEITDARAEKWLVAWQVAGEGKPDFEVPLRLLAAAVAWKPKRDVRALLALPIEERRILEQLLPKDAGAEAMP